MAHSITFTPENLEETTSIFHQLVYIVRWLTSENEQSNVKELIHLIETGTHNYIPAIVFINSVAFSIGHDLTTDESFPYLHISIIQTMANGTEADGNVELRGSVDGHYTVRVY